MSPAELKKKLMTGLVVVTKTGCWEWQKCRQKGGGYGMMSVGNKKLKLTHRIAWELFRGPIPEGIQVCHDCDNPPCCNPNHLFLGTTQDNTEDRHQKGRDASGEWNGNAKLSDEDVAEIRKRYTGRYGELTRLAKEKRVSVDQIRNIVRGKQRMVGVSAVNWISSRRRRKGNEHLGGKKQRSQQT